MFSFLQRANNKERVFAPKGGVPGFIGPDGQWTPASAGDEQATAKAMNRYKAAGGELNSRVFAPRGGVPGYMEGGEYRPYSAGQEQEAAKAMNRYKAAGGELNSRVFAPRGGIPGYMEGGEYRPYSAGQEQEAAKAINRYKAAGGVMVPITSGPDVAPPAPNLPPPPSDNPLSPNRPANTGPVPDTTRVSEAGVKQTGRDLGSIRMDVEMDTALAGVKPMDIPSYVRNPFASNALPTTPTYDSLQMPEAQKRMAYVGTGTSPMPVDEEALVDNPFASDPNSRVNPQLGGPSADPVAMNGGLTGRTREIGSPSFNDMEMEAGDPAAYATSAQEMKRRAAFLDDTTGSIAKMMDNTLGTIGRFKKDFKNYLQTGDGEAIELDNQTDYRYRMGQITAEEAKNAMMGGSMGGFATEIGPMIASTEAEGKSKFPLMAAEEMGKPNYIEQAGLTEEAGSTNPYMMRQSPEKFMEDYKNLLKTGQRIF
jgi:hypothetical protein